MKADKLYLFSTIVLMLVCPVVSIAIDFMAVHPDHNLIFLTGKWFLFWAIGLRLLIAGFKQVVDPGFTLEKIFKIQNRESQIVIRELGFANICFGLLGLISLFFAQFRLSAAIGGGLYLGIAGIYHIIKKPVSKNEVIAMVSDLFIFLIMIIFVLNDICLKQ
jgi:hypothetical protein